MLRLVLRPQSLRLFERFCLADSHEGDNILPTLRSEVELEPVFNELLKTKVGITIVVLTFFPCCVNISIHKLLIRIIDP